MPILSRLIPIITSADPAVRNQSLDGVCQNASVAELLHECEQLDQFRRQNTNLYERVRALFFLYAIHRFHLPAAFAREKTPSAKAQHTVQIPYSGYQHLLSRRFDEAIDLFLAAQSTNGSNPAISSALASAYHRLAFRTLADQVRHSVRTVRGNQWMFRMGHPADQPLRLRAELRNTASNTPAPILRECTPVRMDLSHSGWSDIFFLGMDYPEGARVINISIDLSVHKAGQAAKPRPPVEAYLRVISEPILRLTSVDLDTTADITTCPGTDTCNLAISSSYGITRVLETMMKEEFPDIIYNNDIKIKISGCMNGCGQHSSANIGFHGSSIKNGKLVLPAIQVLLGGGFNGVGEGTMGDKVIKLPAKRGPATLRTLLHDYETNAYEGEYYNDYFLRQGNKYFYALLRPLADLTTLTSSDYVDWDHDEPYQTEVGVGECASVLIDLVGTTLIEAQEKLVWANENLEKAIWADAIYHAYNVFVTGAKALLITKSVATNTQYGIVRDFDEHFGVDFGRTSETGSFKELVFSINKNEPTESFARTFVGEAVKFLQQVNKIRQTQLASEDEPELSLVEFGKDS